MSELIFEVKGIISLVKIYNDHIECEFYGLGAAGGKFTSSVKVEDITSVNLLPAKQFGHPTLEINYKGKSDTKPNQNPFSDLPYLSSVKKEEEFLKAMKIIDLLCKGESIESAKSILTSDMLNESDKKEIGKRKKNKIIVALIAGALVFLLIYYIIGPSIEKQIRINQPSKGNSTNCTSSSAKSFLLDDMNQRSQSTYMESAHVVSCALISSDESSCEFVFDVIFRDGTGMTMKVFRSGSRWQADVY